MNQKYAIEVADLHKTYREGLVFAKRFQALNGISLTVQRGEIFGLLGPNGAGKTTFIKILLGIVRKTEGSASMLGLPAGDRRSRRQVGYLSENMRIPRYHNALTALSLYGRLSGMPQSDVKAKRMHLLEMVGLADRIKDPVRKFSKGMLQRLGLAQALLHDPQLVFLDEPTDGLDPVGRSDVRTIIQRLKQEGRTIFLNSHLLQEVELVCDRVAILDHGNLRTVGSLDEIVGNVPTEGIQLELELHGQQAVVQSTMEHRDVVHVQPLAADRFSLQVRLANQTEVDGCIDELRSRGVSIVKLSPKRISLEEAFLQILNKKI